MRLTVMWGCDRDDVVHPWSLSRYIRESSKYSPRIWIDERK
jgi:hypothetical protein